MAQKKKSSEIKGSLPAAGKTTRTNTSKKTSTQSSKKSGSKSTKNTKRNQDTLASRFTPYIIIVFAIVLGVCLIAGDGVGVVGTAVSNFLKGFFGACAYLIPVLMVIQMVMYSRDKIYGTQKTKFVGFLVMFLFVDALFCVFGGYNEELEWTMMYNAGKELVGGGIVGDIIGGLMVKGFGKVITSIVSLTVIAFVGLYIFGYTPKSVFIAAAYGAEKLKENYNERRETESAYEREYIANRNKMGDDEREAYVRAKRTEEAELRRARRAEKREQMMRENAEMQAEIRLRREEKEKAAAEAKAQAEKEAANNKVFVSSAGVSGKYHVTRKRPEDFTEVNVFADENKNGDENNTEIAETVKTEKVETKPETDTVKQPEIKNGFSEAVDEKIYNEVMKRTQERIARNAREKGISLPTEAETRKIDSQGKPAIENITLAGDVSELEITPTSVTRPAVTEAGMRQMSDDFYAHNESATDADYTSNYLGKIETDNSGCGKSDKTEKTETAEPVTVNENTKTTESDSVVYDSEDAEFDRYIREAISAKTTQTEPVNTDSSEPEIEVDDIITEPETIEVSENKADEIKVSDDDDKLDDILRIAVDAALIRHSNQNTDENAKNYDDSYENVVAEFENSDSSFDEDEIDFSGYFDEEENNSVSSNEDDDLVKKLRDTYIHDGESELKSELDRHRQENGMEPSEIGFGDDVEGDMAGEVEGTLDVQTETQPQVEEVKHEYVFPPVSLLDYTAKDVDEEAIKAELSDNAQRLVDTLESFHVSTTLDSISRGPTITRYELLPKPGTRVRSITNLVDDIALNLATSGVRIEAPIPGKSAVGIEVPNKVRSTVYLKDLIADESFESAKGKLTVGLGQDVAGQNVYLNIAKMPHLLIAGATGMGKSVCINSLITSILYKASPDEVKLILIDPKKVEFNIYNGIPHLIVPVVSEPKKAAGALAWAVSEMERRFDLIEDVGARNLDDFNRMTEGSPEYEHLSQVVIIIDELADLMMTAPDEVEDYICRIAQKARAAGMHLVIGTQRPSVDVITGLIKANIPSRISFKVSSQIDSRTIIDKSGAENLIGNGDMLYNPVGAMKPVRVQGAFVETETVISVVQFIKSVNAGSQAYSDEVQAQIEQEAARCAQGKKGKGGNSETDSNDSMSVGDEEDPMLLKAIELAVDSGKISTSLIQRRLQLGYGRAAKLIDRMEQLGYVSKPEGQKPRDVYITREQFLELSMNI